MEIEKHWNVESKKIIPTFDNSNQPGKVSDIDVAVVLASLLARPIDDTEEFFGPADPRVIASADAIKNKNQISKLRLEAQNYLNTVQKCVDPDTLDLTEQFDRNTGKPRGATQLTWSGAAYLTALMAKHQVE